MRLEICQVDGLPLWQADHVLKRAEHSCMRDDERVV